MKLSIIGVLAIVALLGGCSKAKDAIEVGETSKRLEKKTEQVAETSEKLLDTSEELNENSAQLVEDSEQLVANTTATISAVAQTKIIAEETKNIIDTRTILQRLGDGSVVRNTQFQQIRKMKSFRGKRNAAATYLVAFDFQLWTNQGKDDEDLFKQLKLYAVEEFFNLINEFGDLRAFKDEDPTKKSDDNLESLFALALVLHKVNDVAKELLPDDMSNVSMLEIIKDSLRLGFEAKNNPGISHNMETYHREVMINEAQAIELLKMRFNKMMTVPLNEISDFGIERRGIFSRMGAWFKKTWQNSVGKWKSSFTKINSEKRNFVLKATREAKKTRDFLESIGIRVKLHKKVERAYKHMKFASEKDVNKSENIELKSQAAEFKSLISNLKKTNDKKRLKALGLRK